MHTYWQPRVAVHFGAKLLKWAMFDFGQGIPRVLVVVNPTARKQSLRALDMRKGRPGEFFQFQHGEARRTILERLGVAYRAGQARLAVGAFWHGHPSRYRPGQSGTFWDDKIRRNVEGDREVDEALQRRGWHVLRIRDFEVNADAAEAARRVASVVGGLRELAMDASAASQRGPMTRPQTARLRGVFNLKAP